MVGKPARNGAAEGNGQQSSFRAVDRRTKGTVVGRVPLRSDGDEPDDDA